MPTITDTLVLDASSKAFPEQRLVHGVTIKALATNSADVFVTAGGGSDADGTRLAAQLQSGRGSGSITMHTENLGDLRLRGNVGDGVTYSYAG